MVVVWPCLLSRAGCVDTSSSSRKCGRIGAVAHTNAPRHVLIGALDVVGAVRVRRHLHRVGGCCRSCDFSHSRSLHLSESGDV